MKKRISSSKNYKGQLELSFGMIFSIILIIIFISFAFYAIQKFLRIQDAVKVGQFVENLQSDIDKIWKSNQGSQKREFFLSQKIEYACFVDYSSAKKGKNQEFYKDLKQFYYENENLIFYPGGSAEELNAFEIKHIDLEKITENENPFCIENLKGKIKTTIKKNYEDALVMIERQ